MIGTLVSDAKLRVAPSGTKVVNFTSVFEHGRPNVAGQRKKQALQARAERDEILVWTLFMVHGIMLFAGICCLGDLLLNSPGFACGVLMSAVLFWKKNTVEIK